MRGMLRTLGLCGGILVILGCHHDKYHIRPEHVEEYYLPPDEARYNLPDVAPYKKPPAQKDEKLIDKKGGMGPSMTGGGF